VYLQPPYYSETCIYFFSL